MNSQVQRKVHRQTRLNSWPIRSQNLKLVLPILLGLFIGVVPLGHAAEKEHVREHPYEVMVRLKDVETHGVGQDIYFVRGKIEVEWFQRQCKRGFGY